jgi:hypothetical protein
MRYPLSHVHDPELVVCVWDGHLQMPQSVQSPSGPPAQNPVSSSHTPSYEYWQPSDCPEAIMLPQIEEPSLYWLSWTASVPAQSLQSVPELQSTPSSHQSSSAHWQESSLVRAAWPAASVIISATATATVSSVEVCIFSEPVDLCWLKCVVA